MEKYLIRNEIDWERTKTEIKSKDVYDPGQLEPKSFPVIVIIAYAGAGWYEIDFCYPGDFREEDLP